jgi:hypothetical protein
MVPPLAHPTDTGATHAGSLLEARTATPRTDLQIRNYDDRSYEVTLVARDDDGVAFEREYHLAPGELRAERAVIEPGEYNVTATASLTLDKRDAAVCRVGADPADTVCVEIGNHIVNVSEGVY